MVRHDDSSSHETTVDLRGSDENSRDALPEVYNQLNCSREATKQSSMVDNDEECMPSRKRPSTKEKPTQRKIEDYFGQMGSKTTESQSKKCCLIHPRDKGIMNKPAVKPSAWNELEIFAGRVNDKAASSVDSVPKLDKQTENSTDDIAIDELQWLATVGDSWFEALKDEIRKQYFMKLIKTVDNERRHKKVYPPSHLVFNAFKTTPFEKIKAVIVGQDPYHGPGQAMGLCFSVNKGVKVPPSLVNMFKEIGATPSHGDLTHWARQGVFMLNSLLTVVESQPMSHKHLGWAEFTDKVISVIDEKCSGAVFMLWGKPAQQKGKQINRTNHLVLEAGHPSPLSVRHFAGCDHFRKCNDYLAAQGKTRIDWALPQ